LDQQTWSPAVTSAAVLWSDSCSTNSELFGLKELLVLSSLFARGQEVSAREMHPQAPGKRQCWHFMGSIQGML